MPSTSAHVGRRVSVQFNDNGRYKFFDGTVETHDPPNAVSVRFDADDAVVEYDVQEMESEGCLWSVWRWIDHELVGMRVRRYVEEDGTIVGHDTGTPIEGNIVAWIGATEEDPACWHAVLKAADGEVLEEDLEEDEAREAVAACPAASPSATSVAASATSSSAAGKPGKKRAAAESSSSSKARKPAAAGKGAAGKRPQREEAADEVAADEVLSPPKVDANGRTMRARKVVNYAKFESKYDDESMGSASDDEDEDDGGRARDKPKGKTKGRAAGGGGRKRKAPTAGDEEFAFSGAESSFEESDDDYEEEDEDFEGGKKKKKPPRARKAATAKPRARASSSAGGEGGEGGEGGGGGGAGGKSHWPFPKRVRSRPTKQPSQPFVDPAGLDIEDRGVEWIVEVQCDKLEPLLRDALQHGELELSMATACSGTDAPVVAMIVAQETLARKGLAFDFEHVMSCELEPYKQSFIARNHPEVLIFPDIRVLGATAKGEEATTVYGGTAPIPSADMLVAGTSCKDFSGLKGKDRKSIEAMGTSGQTFFGFVELLLEQGYRTAIVENVFGAEWAKMAQYISGRVPVADADGLGFERRPDGGWVVSEVGGAAGVRVGTKLKGFMRVGGKGIADETFVRIGGEAKKSKGGDKPKASKASFETLASDYGVGGGDTLVFELPVEYHCKLLDMDAKEFGLPQTRTRNYMLIWRPELYPKGAEVAELWADLVDHLRCPLKYPIDSFLLSDENDRVHRFRDALQGPLGRLTALDKQSGDWWDETDPAANKDTLKAKQFRACEGRDHNPTNKNCLSTPCDQTARPFTGWAPNSKISLACERWWPEYLSVLNQRELDLIDCFGIVAAEAGVDPLHHSLWWNVSQNVGRTDVLVRPGITSCITPGGENFGPHRGRCILGYEKLLLSGIPADKLLLGTETEVQLSDLAGNAMAMPVVSAAILAALCVPAYARALAADKTFSLSSMAEKKVTPSSPASKGGGAGRSPQKGATSAAGKASAKKGAKAGAAGGKKGAATGATAGATDLDSRLLSLLPLCAEAERSSILCTCETSGGVSDSGIVRCADCLLSICRSCGSQSNLKWHEGGTPSDHPCCVEIGGDGKGAACGVAAAVAGGAPSSTSAACSARACQKPAVFEQTLRGVAPTAIALDETSLAHLTDLGVEGLLPPDVTEGEEAHFRLTRVVRERGFWMLGYSVCDPKVGTPLAELRVTVGRLGAGRGLSALLYSFAPALRGERGRMPPVARALIHDTAIGEAAGSAKAKAKSTSASTVSVPWEVRGDAQPCKLRLTATSLVPSYRSEVGLLSYADEMWPDELHVVPVAGNGKIGEACAGVYERQRCRYSCVFGALWRRRATPGGSPTLWLFIRPTVDRTSTDEMVISTSPIYSDCDSHVVAEIVPPAPSDASDAASKGNKAKKKGDALDEPERAAFKLLCELGKPSTAAEGATAAPKAKKPKAAASVTAAGGSAGAGKAVTCAARERTWQPFDLRFVVPQETTRVEVRPFGVELSDLPAATSAKLIDAATSRKLGEIGGGSARAAAADKDGWHELRVLTASSTIAERRLAEAVAAPLLQFAACNGLEGFGRWQVLRAEAGGPLWGACKTSAPPRPCEVWTRDGQRTYDVKASNEFELALRARPSAWDVQIRNDGRLKVAARPHVAAHRASEALLRGRGLDPKSLTIEWLVDTQRATLAASSLTNFSIPTSAKFAASAERPPFFKPGKALFARQARALSRMVAIDAGEIGFDEVEYSDHTLSSGVGWTLNVRAVRSGPLRGGVLADAVGAGKTVNAIALIASCAKAARAAREKGVASSPCHSGATLVVAPVHCVKPVWRQLLGEFTSDLVCEVVERLDDLKALSVARLRNADVVVVACELLYNTFGEGGRKGAWKYQEHLSTISKTAPLPSFLSERKQSRLVGNEPDILTGVWVPNSSQDPFGKSAARQEDRDVAALFTVRYLEAVDALRKMKFSDKDKGVPLEWFEWERLIVDECHESLVLGQDDAERQAASETLNIDETGKDKELRKCAQRELLGIGQSNMAKRPIRVRRSTWGLTGTPLLSSETRITELAALCGGTYVTGNAAHWRMMERASTRDVFLRYHETASSLVYMEERTRAAQGYIDAAVQRNRIDAELGHIRRTERIVPCKLEAASDYEQLLKKHKDLRGAFSPPYDACPNDGVWQSLLKALAGAPARQQALRDTIQQIHKKDEWTKIIVFAPAGAAFDAARAALAGMRGTPVLVGGGDDAYMTEKLARFSQPDIQDPARPRVLLMSFDYSSALNLQHVSHNIVFYAPLWGEDPVGVHAAANEQQAIGRVVRIGQTQDVVVHRLIVVGPKGQETIEQRIVERNTSQDVTRQAVNT